MTNAGWGNRKPCTPPTSYPHSPTALEAPRPQERDLPLPPMAAATISLCGSRCLGTNLRPEPRLASQAAAAAPLYARPSSSRRRLVLVAAKPSGKQADEKVPSWARPGSDEAPPWARGEDGASGQDAGGEDVQVPFYAYLLASAVTAIAAVRSLHLPLSLSRSTAQSVWFTNFVLALAADRVDIRVHQRAGGVRRGGHRQPALRAHPGLLCRHRHPDLRVPVVQGRADGEQGRRGAGPQRRLPVTSFHLAAERRAY
ncbi:unnamed protein product [Alopecurus aequalis]